MVIHVKPVQVPDDTVKPGITNVKLVLLERRLMAHIQAVSLAILGKSVAVEKIVYGMEKKKGNVFAG